jgi:hypothetical protein
LNQIIRVFDEDFKVGLPLVSFCGGEICESAEGLIWTPTALVWFAALNHNHISDRERPT